MAVMSAEAGVSALPDSGWWDRFRWGMAERADGISLLAFPADSGQVADYEEGVAFAECGEARWRRAADGLWRLVWIDEAGGRLNDKDFVDLVGAGDGTVLLWGPESRIPVRPVYAGVADGRRAQAKVRHYEFEEEAWIIDCGRAIRRNARRRISRLVSLEEVAE